MIYNNLQDRIRNEDIFTQHLRDSRDKHEEIV